MKVDFEVMTDDDFKDKHGESREVFAKENDLKYEKK